MAIEIVDLPTKMVIFDSYVNVYQGVMTGCLINGESNQH